MVMGMVMVMVMGIGDERYPPSIESRGRAPQVSSPRPQQGSPWGVC
jgi:hypothetical protein